MSLEINKDLEIKTVNSKKIVQVLNMFCLNIEEHPADFVLLEEFSVQKSNKLVAIFDRMKVWAVERTMTSITGKKEEFVIHFMDSNTIKFQCENNHIHIILDDNSENDQNIVITVNSCG
ncbi:hypothetical protein [Bacillus thuringiensis]|uniref:Uncharacterized protein n=1 Tax=Bacillus thuringiensis TaxID=1428 RepID=A0A9X6WT33_BACTU|nr:hypothetical protein [Bacillus thuringiensis]PFJ42775.1 hypothetical protein COJ15_05385 [Bacillus thuringiensis]